VTVVWPHLDQVAVRIADIAADFGFTRDRWREKLGAPRAPVLVHRLDVRNSDIEEAADPIWVTGRLQDDGRLVVGRAAADVDDDPAVGERDVCRLTSADGLAA
jgi:hypothetical protein